MGLSEARVEGLLELAQQQLVQLGDAQGDAWGGGGGGGAAVSLDAMSPADLGEGQAVSERA